MPIYKFGDIVIDTKNKVDRDNNYYEHYIAGDHMDSEDLKLHRKGCFATDDVGPAFIRKFSDGQILYGSRRTYLKKVAVADFCGITSNTTFVFDPKDEKKVIKELIPFIMLSAGFTQWSISKSKGSTNPYILFSDLCNYTFKVPDLSAQKILANVLWSLELTKRTYVTSIDKINQYVESKFISLFGSQKVKQNNWELIPLSKVVEKPQNGEWGDEDTDGTGIKVLRTTNFTDDGVIKYDDVITRKIALSKISSKKMITGDILIEKSGGADDKPVGRVVLFDRGDDEYLSNNFTAVLRVADERISYKYLFSFLYVNYDLGGTKKYENKTTGIHNLKLNEYLENSYIPIPDKKTQEVFEKVLEQALITKRELNSAIDAVRSLTNKLINENFVEVKEDK